MKTKRSTSLRKTIKKQNAGGFGDFLKRTFRKKTTPTTSPNQTTKYNLKTHLIMKEHLLQLLLNIIDLPIAQKKLESELDDLKDLEKKNMTTERDRDLIENIIKEIDHIKLKIRNLPLEISRKQIDDVAYLPSDRKLEDIMNKIDQKEITELKSYYQDLKNLNDEEFKNKIFQKFNGLVENIKFLSNNLKNPNFQKKNTFNNKAAATYKKYSQFRVGLFNNIERNKKERRERIQDKSKRNQNNIKRQKEEIEKIYEKMVENRNNVLDISKKIHKNEEFINNSITPMMQKIKDDKNTSNHETNELLGKLEYYIKKKKEENNKHLDKINSLNQEFSVLTTSSQKYILKYNSDKINPIKEKIKHTQTEISKYISGNTASLSLQTGNTASLHNGNGNTDSLYNRNENTDSLNNNQRNVASVHSLNIH
jgi:hypothetical protein